MEKLAFDFQKLLSSDEPLTFLAGAGISVDPPSCLASARGIMSDIIKFCCPKDAADDLLSEPLVSRIRYEYILGLFRDNLDTNLKIMDYFTQAERPNALHKFLAGRIRKGNIVMTTNFDFLIEYALGLGDKNARAVITKGDFQKFTDPVEMAQNDMNVLYKLHGSQKNVFTGEDTAESVITTLDALAKEKEENIFALPHYERETFIRACKAKTLVVMGYSGGDVFDIIPALMHTKDLKRVVWIEHTAAPGGTITSYKITASDTQQDSPLDQLLQQLNRGTGVEVIKMRGNTSHICAGQTHKPNARAMEERIEPPLEWIVTHFEQVSDGLKEHLAARIYDNYDVPNKALTHYQQSYDRYEEIDNDRGMAAALGNMGLIYRQTGEPKKAREHHQRAYEIHKQLKNLSGMADDLGNVGIIYMQTGVPKKALEHHQRAYDIYKQLNNLHGMASALGNMGNAYMQTGEPQKALEHHQRAYNIHKQLNNLQGMANQLGNMGIIYMQTGEPKKARGKFETCLRLSKQIHYKAGIDFATGQIKRIVDSLDGM
ncbi:MAG: tetratricopeptide repeat protein [Candidatus Lokiarchaeota archaeon]|nr:tetratricopeptide repeat protein [Candidatus Lokiarchaeota archaeon]